MKANAIIRILIWCLVLFLLVGLLAVGLYRPGRRMSENPPAATAVPLKEPAVAASEESGPILEATVTATAVNIRSAPTSDSPSVGMLEQNDTVVITNRHTVEGEDWVFITHPSAGWVQAQYLATEDSSETRVANTFSLDPEQVREIDIEWAAGSIIIEAADVDSIQFTEAMSADPGHPMAWKQDSDKLTIRFSESTTFGFGINLTGEIAKDLTILVPADWECGSLEIDAASATVEVKNLMIREVDFDGANGICTFDNCVIDELDMDTASGDIYFSGSLNTLDCDAASASVFAVFDNAPSRIDMDSMSGDLDITLHENVGFTVSMDALSSDFVCEFGYGQSRDGTYSRGDGKCRITLDAMSGDLYIREYKEADAKAVIPIDPTASETHHHTDACTTDPDSCPDNATHHTDAHHN